MTPKRVIEAWIDNVWNEGDADYIEKGFAADGVMTALAASDIRGPTDYRAFVAEMNEALADIEMQLGDFVENGDRFAGYLRVKARHRASGKRVAFDSFFIGEIKDGKIFRAHNCTDFLGMMTQAGALPADALPSALAGKPVFNPADYRDE